jgi:hypothetical protein
VLIRAGQISSDDRLKRDNLCFLDEHRPSIELIPVLPYLLWHLVHIYGHEVVRDNGSELVEPKLRYFCEDFAFIWDTLAPSGY